MKCIVSAVDWRGAPPLNFPFRGVRQNVYQFTSNKVDLNNTEDYMRALRGVDTVFCEEEDLEGIIDAMSTHFAGADITVYKIDSVSVRTPGELKTKAITKDGVLPT